MKALIWAAGFGKRLMPLTELLPKPLFPVVNIPMIDLILAYLKSRGINQVGINTHYLRNPLILHLKKIASMEIFTTEEEHILGTGGGTVPFREFLKDEEFFIIHTSDILSNINLNDAIKFHKARNNMVTLILVDHKPINHVTILKDGTIIDIANYLGKRSTPGTVNLAGSAISIYSSEIFKWLPDKIEYFEINTILLEIIKKYPGKIKGYIPEKNFYWRDIGTVKSYWEAHRDILIDKLYEVESLKNIQNHIIEPSCKIEKNVKLEGFNVIGKNVRLKGNLSIKNSIIWDNVALSGIEKIENSIITEKHKLEIQ